MKTGNKLETLYMGPFYFDQLKGSENLFRNMMRREKFSIFILWINSCILHFKPGLIISIGNRKMYGKKKRVMSDNSYFIMHTAN